MPHLGNGATCSLLLGGSFACDGHVEDTRALVTALSQHSVIIFLASNSLSGDVKGRSLAIAGEHLGIAGMVPRL